MKPRMMPRFARFSPVLEPFELEMSLLATKPRIIPRNGMKKLTTNAAMASPDVCALGEVGETERVWINTTGSGVELAGLP
jgi:hypothetical protein